MIERLGKWLAGGLDVQHFADLHIDDRVTAIIARVDGLEARVDELEKREPPPGAGEVK